jgi:hypothetical protein
MEQELFGANMLTDNKKNTYEKLAERYLKRKLKGEGYQDIEDYFACSDLMAFARFLDRKQKREFKKEHGL